MEVVGSLGWPVNQAEPSSVVGLPYRKGCLQILLLPAARGLLCHDEEIRYWFQLAEVDSTFLGAERAVEWVGDLAVVIGIGRTIEVEVGAANMCISKKKDI